MLVGEALLNFKQNSVIILSDAAIMGAKFIIFVVTIIFIIRMYMGI